jgi:hypothetical protein
MPKPNSIIKKIVFVDRKKSRLDPISGRIQIKNNVLNKKGIVQEIVPSAL